MKKSIIFLSFFILLLFFHEARSIGWTKLNVSIVSRETTSTTTISRKITPREAFGITQTTITLTPAIEVEYPHEVVVFINEPSSFLVSVKNSGNISLSNLILEFPTLKTVSFIISPPSFPKLEVNKTEIFMVNLTSRKQGIITTTFMVKTDLLEEIKTIKIITLNRTEVPVNLTEFNLKIKTIQEMLNSTIKVLAILMGQGYEITPFLENLKNVDFLVNESLSAFQEGNYVKANEDFSKAYELLQDIMKKIYEKSKEREMSYVRYGKILTIVASLVLALLVLLFIKVFLLKK